MSELTKAFENIKSNNSLGTDGFSSEFFKVFWDKIGIFVMQLVNHSYNIG